MPHPQHRRQAAVSRRSAIANTIAFTAALPLALPAARAQTATAHAPSAAVQANPLLAPNPAEFKRQMQLFTAGKTPAASGLALEISALADNPSAVPVKVALAQAPTEQLWCEEIVLLAELNPSPLVCRLQFTQLAGAAEAAVRIRLSQSQTVHALARLSNGQILAAKQAVTVAASGCGM